MGQPESYFRPLDFMTNCKPSENNDMNDSSNYYKNFNIIIR